MAPLLGIYTGKPLAEQTAEHIIKYIMERELSDGDKLPNEFELAQSIGVGRSTVREAMKILVSRNVVEIRRGAGTFVAEQMGVAEDPLGLAFVRDKTSLAMDLLDVRLMLEPEIARMAAKNATKEDAASLERQCRKVEEIIASGENHMQEDIVFHIMIAAFSGYVVVVKLVPVIHSSIAVFIDVTNGALREETVKTHREIVECVSAGDGEGARWAMEMHLLYNRMSIKEVRRKWDREGNEYGIDQSENLRTGTGT